MMTHRRTPDPQRHHYRLVAQAHEAVIRDRLLRRLGDLLRKRSPAPSTRKPPRLMGPIHA
jgi:hypothetical protein